MLCKRPLLKLLDEFLRLDIISFFIKKFIKTLNKSFILARRIKVKILHYLAKIMHTIFNKLKVTLSGLEFDFLTHTDS